jgi:hypothetical protein
MRYLPVAPLATSSALHRAERELEAHEADEAVIASLVRVRLQLDKARGWLLLIGLGSTAAMVVGLGVVVRDKWMLGMLAPVIASVPFGIGLFAERACFAYFARLAKSHGLSARAAKRIYDGALGADHWIAVLASCNRPPSDGEIASFVIPARSISTQTGSGQA